MNVEASNSKLRTARLGGSLGIEMHGLDIGKLGAEDMAAIRAALLDHHVVVLRGQHVTPASVDAFAKRLGPSIHYDSVVSENGIPGFPDVVVLDNKGYDANVTQHWHSDGSMFPEPPCYTVLGCHIIPEAGGNTMFANQHRAYETLSPALQDMLSQRRACHELKVPDGSGGFIDYSSAHPVIVTHPENGRRALYVSNFFTTCFEGMTIEESRGLLDYLLRHAVQPEFLYSHRWQRGDVLVWDNRSVLHRAVKDYGTAQRVMYHMEVQKQAPAG